MTVWVGFPKMVIQPKFLTFSGLIFTQIFTFATKLNPSEMSSLVKKKKKKKERGLNFSEIKSPQKIQNFFVHKIKSAWTLIHLGYF